MRRQINHHWFREWLVAWTALSHSLNQCWNIVNWTHRNKLQWNFNRNKNNFIEENSLENVICEMASILSRPECVNIEDTNSYVADNWEVRRSHYVADYYNFLNPTVIFPHFHTTGFQDSISVPVGKPVSGRNEAGNELYPIEVHWRPLWTD